MRSLLITEQTTKETLKTPSTSVFDRNGFQMLKQESLSRSSWKQLRNVGQRFLFNSKISIPNLHLIYSILTEINIPVSTMMYAPPFVMVLMIRSKELHPSFSVALSMQFIVRESNLMN